MGKSPLRLVCSRTETAKGVWREILECGHEYETYTPYLWDSAGCLIEAEITAKRRRCRKCNPPAAILKTRAEITADQARAALIHKRKLQFGSLFDKFCDANGVLLPGPSEAELLAELNPKTESNALGCAGLVDEEPNADGTSNPAPYEFPSPKKPVQSIRTIEKRRIA